MNDKTKPVAKPQSGSVELTEQQKAAKAAEAEAQAKADAEAKAKADTEAAEKAAAESEAAAKAAALESGGGIIYSTHDKPFTFHTGVVCPGRVGGKDGYVAVDDVSLYKNHGVFKQMEKAGVFRIEASKAKA